MPLKLYVFWKNPLNYVGLAATTLLELFFRVCFVLYGKDVKVLTKKLAAVCNSAALRHSFPMQRDSRPWRATEFDLVVIGGGMFGAAAALDAAQRGLRMALVERADFGGATSSHSFKMVHGGIRYLQHADVAGVRHSARARSTFLRVAPHLVQPLPIVIPTYGWGMKSKPVLRAGMAAYDLLTVRSQSRHRRPGTPDPNGTLHRARRGCCAAILALPARA